MIEFYVPLDQINMLSAHCDNSCDVIVDVVEKNRLLLK